MRNLPGVKGAAILLGTYMCWRQHVPNASGRPDETDSELAVETEAWKDQG